MKSDGGILINGSLSTLQNIAISPCGQDKNYLHFVIERHTNTHFDNWARSVAKQRGINQMELRSVARRRCVILILARLVTNWKSSAFTLLVVPSYAKWLPDIEQLWILKSNHMVKDAERFHTELLHLKRSPTPKPPPKMRNIVSWKTANNRVESRSPINYSRAIETKVGVLWHQRHRLLISFSYSRFEWFEWSLERQSNAKSRVSSRIRGKNKKRSASDRLEISAGERESEVFRRIRFHLVFCILKFAGKEPTQTTRTERQDTTDAGHRS